MAWDKVVKCFMAWGERDWDRFSNYQISLAWSTMDSLSNRDGTMVAAMPGPLEVLQMTILSKNP